MADFFDGDPQVGVTICPVTNCPGHDCDDPECAWAWKTHHHHSDDEPSPATEMVVMAQETVLPQEPDVDKPFFAWNLCVRHCALAEPCRDRHTCPAAQEHVPHHHHPEGYGAETFLGLGEQLEWRGFEERQEYWEPFAHVADLRNRPAYRRHAETFLPPGALAAESANDGNAHVISHGGQTGQETFVPEGVTAFFDTQHGTLLFINEWIRAAAVGALAAEEIAEGNPVHNYVISALSSEELELMQYAIGAVTGIPYVAGFNLDERIELCSSPGACQNYRESEHRPVHHPDCRGIFGYTAPVSSDVEPIRRIPQSNIYFHICRSISGVDPEKKDPRKDFNREQLNYRELLNERAEALLRIADNISPLRARLELGSYSPHTQTDIRASYEDENFRLRIPHYLSLIPLYEATPQDIAETLISYEALGDTERQWLRQGDPVFAEWLSSQHNTQGLNNQQEFQDKAASRLFLELVGQSRLTEATDVIKQIRDRRIATAMFAKIIQIDNSKSLFIANALGDATEDFFVIIIEDQPESAARLLWLLSAAGLKQQIKMLCDRLNADVVRKAALMFNTIDTHTAIEAFNNLFVVAPACGLELREKAFHARPYAAVVLVSKMLEYGKLDYVKTLIHRPGMVDVMVHGLIVVELDSTEDAAAIIKKMGYIDQGMLVTKILDLLRETNSPAFDRLMYTLSKRDSSAES